MPIIIPPSLLDIPAIVRSAAHSSAKPLPAQDSTPPRPVEQPAGSGQNPDIVGPVSPPPRLVPRPAGSGQAPDVVGPVAPPPPLPATTPGAATS